MNHKPDNQFVKARVDAADCINSLQIAMQLAGGCCLDTKRMREMSLLEFVTEVAAQNGIRFVYENPEKI